MAVGFIQLNENDTKELRKEIGLPVTTSEDYSISNVNNKDELVEVGDLDEGWQGKLLSRFGKLEREFSNGTFLFYYGKCWKRWKNIFLRNLCL